MIEVPLTPNSQSNNNKMRKVGGFLVMLVALFAIIFAGVFIFLSSPPNINLPTSLEIENGMSVREIAEAAHEAGLVRSEILLYSLLTAFYDPTNIYAGRYVFEERKSVFEVAEKIASSDIDQTLVTLTFPEGMRIKEMAEIAERRLMQFNTNEYTTLALSDEGYLFPETYYVPEDFTAESLYKLQRNTFDAVTEPLFGSRTDTTLTQTEIVTLASIIEREANNEDSMRMVSGILQNRLSIGMALQADASIEYVLDRPINELLPGELADYLEETDSPYNTYKYAGLPPTPIGNPGLMAIEAALNPTPSEYLFYITGNDGTFYYAETLDEHNENIDRYLR